MEQVLKSVLKHSPSLSALFLQGTRVSDPFRTKPVNSTDTVFKGHRFPTYFRFKGKPAGETLVHDAHLDSRCRVTLETDAMNDSFLRVSDRGVFSLLIEAG